MKRLIRNNKFETNKSNVHSIGISNNKKMGIWIGDAQLIMFGDSNGIYILGDFDNEKSNS